MEITEAQYRLIEHCLPTQRGNVSLSNLRVLNAFLFVAEFAQLQHAQIVRIKIEAVGLDSTAVKVHPDGTGALKKTARKPLASPAADGPPRFIWLPRMLERP